MSSVDVIRDINKSCCKAGSRAVIQRRLCPANRSRLDSMSGDGEESGYHRVWSYTREMDHTIYSCSWKSASSFMDQLVRKDPVPDELGHWGDSSSQINHMGALSVACSRSVLMHLPDCVINPQGRGGGVILAFFGGWDIYFSFQGLKLMWLERARPQSADKARAGARLVVPHHQWAAASGTVWIGVSTGSQK